jgi:hypothetical protein
MSAADIVVSITPPFAASCSTTSYGRYVGIRADRIGASYDEPEPPLIRSVWVLKLQQDDAYDHAYPSGLLDITNDSTE